MMTVRRELATGSAALPPLSPSMNASKCKRVLKTLTKMEIFRKVIGPWQPPNATISHILFHSEY